MTEPKNWGIAGRECSYCQGWGLFHLEEGGYRCEECLTYFDENMEIISIAKGAKKLPVRPVRFIGPHWLIWLMRRFGTIIEDAK